jgi:uncharacterized membrane protein
MMRDEAPVYRRPIRRPLCAIPTAFAMSCFIATLATDAAYWATANIMWVDFSDWLVTVGVIAGWLAVLVALIEALTARRFRLWPSWPVVIGYVIALILATVNMLVHTRDAWTSVVPWGLVLSAVTVLALLVSGVMRRVAPERYDVRSAEMTP